MLESSYVCLRNAVVRPDCEWNARVLFVLARDVDTRRGARWHQGHRFNADGRVEVLTGETCRQMVDIRVIMASRRLIRSWRIFACWTVVSIITLSCRIKGYSADSSWIRAAPTLSDSTYVKA